MDLSAVFQATPVYAIYDTASAHDLAAAGVAQAWLHAGIRVIQFRHKGQFGRGALEICRELATLVASHGGIFTVNDRVDVALLTQAQGVHVGQDDMWPEDVRRLYPAPAIVGHSTHNRPQIERALKMPIDYLAVGPVFDTSSKANHDPVVGLELLSDARRKTSLPLVAIGGITAENVGSVMQAGANAVAVISGLLAGCSSLKQIEARAHEMISRARSGRPPTPGAP